MGDGLVDDYNFSATINVSPFYKIQSILVSKSTNAPELGDLCIKQKTTYTKQMNTKRIKSKKETKMLSQTS